MRLDWLKIAGFKNLRQVEIDFDEDELSTVLIGENGAGKSNLLEALATIFRDLDLDDPTAFRYALEYECRGHHVAIDARYTDPKSISFRVDGKRSSKAAFKRERDELLPSYVFGYYSGESRRLESVFDKHQERYYGAIIKAGAESKLQPGARDLRRLFYCRSNYGQFALLAYFAFESPETRKFLSSYLEISGMEAALMVLRKPSWAKSRPSREQREQGDERFWHATGLVRGILGGLWEASLAPIADNAPVQDDYRRKAAREERQYIFIRDEAALRALAGALGDERTFFYLLEALDISDLVREVRIWAKQEIDGVEIPFHEISDGERQLLSVLGLMRFTRDDEALFLLDEPDTHLNPAWKWSYLEMVRELTGESAGSHLIMTSHDPLTIASLKASQVQVMYDDEGTIRVRRPGVDPRGLGVTGVLTQIFGLPTTLDPETQEQLDERNLLLSLDTTTAKQRSRLTELTEHLNGLGFVIEAREPEYAAFLQAFERFKKARDRALTPEEIEAQNQLALRLIERLKEAQPS